MPPIETEIPLLRRRRTKIVATLGPASAGPQVLRELLLEGVDVVRLNMSHGTHAEHRKNYTQLRAIAAELGRHTAVMADLCGPKIRAGEFPGGSIELATGARVVVTTRAVEGGPGLIPSQYAGLAEDVRPGARILLDDGNLELRVESVNGSEVECTVVHGGTLNNHKGINLPDVEVSAPSLTDKDREDARFALDLGVDYLALSFVRRADDIESLRALIRDHGHRADIVAKIEKPEALRECDAILAAADAVMVARGDLGVELKPEQVPVAQDLLVDRARRMGKPVIVATQMLESMIAHPRPTRAEVSDVSHAVSSGADAVMLSAESAAGKFPVAAVQMMDRIARQTESFLWAQGAFGSIADEDTQPPVPIAEAVARSTSQLSRDLRVRAIVVLSRGGTSARQVSSARPAAPVISVTTEPATCRRMSLYWGVVPRLAETPATADIVTLAREVVRELQLAQAGDNLLLVRGFADSPALNAPSVTVLTV